MPDHIQEIRSLLDSLTYTAPEHTNGVLRSLMTAVDGLLREHGWTPKGLLVNLPEGVTHDEAQAAVDALGAQGVTTRDRRVVAEVLDRLVQRDIDRRGIRETFKPELLGIDASVLGEFAASMRLGHDGDDVDLARAAVDAVAIGEDGRQEYPDTSKARRAE